MYIRGIFNVSFFNFLFIKKRTITLRFLFSFVFYCLRVLFNVYNVSFNVLKEFLVKLLGFYMLLFNFNLNVFTSIAIPVSC